MKKTVFKINVAVLLCAIVGISFALILFAAKPVKSYAAMNTTQKLYLKNDDRFKTQTHDGKTFYAQDFFDVYMVRANGADFKTRAAQKYVVYNKQSGDVGEFRYEYDGSAIVSPFRLRIQTRPMHDFDKYYAGICNGGMLYGGSHGLPCNYNTQFFSLYKKTNEGNQNAVKVNSNIFKDTVDSCEGNWNDTDCGSSENCVGINPGNADYEALDYTVNSPGEYRVTINYALYAQKDGSAKHKYHAELGSMTANYYFTVGNMDTTAPALGTEYSFNTENVVENNATYYIKNNDSKELFSWNKENNVYINAVGEREEDSYITLNADKKGTNTLSRSVFDNYKNTLIKLQGHDWVGNSSATYLTVYDTVRPFITDSGAETLAAAFHNTALLEQLKRNKEDSKSKTVALGVTNQSVAFPYSAGEGESPINGNYTLKPLVMSTNGEFKLGELKEEKYSGGTLSEEGVYSLTLTDLAGNKTVYEFVIKKTAPQFNSRKIANDSYITPYCYEVKLPAGYTNIALSGSAKYGTNLYNGTFSNTSVYLCETESNALKLAFDLEVQHVAIKTAKGYNYKLISNPKNTFEYVDLAEFEKAVTYFSSRFVTQYNRYKEGANPYLDTAKTIVLDENLRKNSEKNTLLTYENKPAFFIGKDFVFAKNSIVTEQTNGVTNFIYGSKYLQITDLKTGLSLTDSGGNIRSDKFHGQTFTSLVGANEGFFRVQEWDSADNATEYIVYFDMVAPTISVEYSLVGSEEITARNITSKDTISLYLNTFDIVSLTDSTDPYAMVKIDSTTNAEVSGIYATNFPKLSGAESGNGAGKYTFTVYDRSGNKFGFEVHLYGRPPIVKYSAYGSDEARKLTARVNKGESYNAIMNLKIFRNGEQLPATYYEYEGAEPIYIGNENLEYVFTKGGIYSFEITDNFGRVTKTTEFKFTKNMPEVLLSGVSENGKTRQDVTVSLPIDCKFLLLFNGSYSDVGAVKDETKGLQYIFIKATEQASGHYYVKAWRETDPTNYNESRFEIKKIAPTVQLKTKGGEQLESGAVTNDNVYLAWDLSQNIQSVTYVYNDRTTERYAKGEELTRSGKYDFKIKDELGNLTELTVIIDKLVSYEIIANGGGGRLTLSSESVDGVQVQIAKDSFSFVAKEANLNISMLKDGFAYSFTFEQTVTESGRYTVILKDVYGNEAKHVIDIDKIAPKAELSGVENNGSTRGKVSVKVDDTSDIGEVKLYFDNKLTEANILSTYDFTRHGSYRLELYDRAGNITKFVFNIDTVVEYEANIVSGAMTNERVKIALKEDGTVTAQKNGEPIENKDGYFSEVGKYKVTVQDELSNSETLVFEINHAILTDSFSYNLPSGYIIYTVKNFGKPYEGYGLSQDSIVFTEDGEFEIVITDIATKKARIRYMFTIDRVPPTLTIEGVTNGGATKSNILLSNVSKPDVTLKLYLDGKEIATSKTMKLTKNGTYKLILTDKAGNTTEYNFTKQYSFNAFSVILIVLLCLIVLGVVGLIIKIRLRVKVK